MRLSSITFVLFLLTIFKQSFSNESTISSTSSKSSSNEREQQHQHQQQMEFFVDNGIDYKVLFHPLWGGEWIKDLFSSYGFHETKLKTDWNFLWSNRPTKGKYFCSFSSWKKIYFYFICYLF
jgi:hypothetical protein